MMSSKMKTILAVFGIVLLAQAGAILWVSQGHPVPSLSRSVKIIPLDTPDAPLSAEVESLATANTAPLEAEAEENTGTLDTAAEDAKREENVLESALGLMLSQPVAPSGGKDKTASKSHTGKKWDTALAAGVSEEEIATARHLFKQAKKAIEAGDLNAALDLMRQSALHNPMDRQIYREMAELSRKMGLTDDEMQAYQDWMAAMPNDAVPHYMLARTYERMGMDAQALAELQQFQQMSDGSVSSYPMSASVYRSLNMRQEEGAVLSDWAQTAPESMEAHRAYGDYLRRMGDRDGAMAEYQTAIQLTPGEASNYLSAGDLYAQQRQYDLAQQQYLAGLDTSPGNVGLLQHLADTYRREQDYNAAIDTYQQVIDLEPGSNAATQARRNINQIERQIARQNTPVKPK